MRCPFCKHDSDKVIDTRPAEEATAVRRRRECSQCGRRFTTYERIEQSPLKVVKKDGGREPYDRTKLSSGIEKACSNLPIPAEAIEDVVARVDHRLLTNFDREVESRVVGEYVMEELKGLNEVAYVRFASVYRKFQEAGEFYQVLEELRGRTREVKDAD